MSRRAPKGEYIETDTGNKVARKSNLVGTQNIMLGGKTVIQPEVMIRGDLTRSLPPASSSGGGAGGDGATAAAAGAAAAAGGGGGGGGGKAGGGGGGGAAAAPATNTAVAIGRYCFLSRGSCLRPPGRVYKGSFTYMPLRLGDHVFVGEGSVIQAASVGSHVRIGSKCVVGDFAIVKDYVEILDGAVVPSNMVVPSFSVVAGSPAEVVGEVPEGGLERFECRELYKTVGNAVTAHGGAQAGGYVHR